MMTGKHLATYDPMAQHYGTWIKGYPWNIYGCGTFRNQVNKGYAIARMRRAIEHLEKRLGPPVSYFAALEDRPSGCGMSPIKLHWHFVAACKHHEGMSTLLEGIWKKLCGLSLIKPYDPTSQGSFYVSKLASRSDTEILENNLELLEYHGPSDLIAAAQASSYVQPHLADKVFGKYMVMLPNRKR
jgi:hypothetical protein